jgi:hypothetical protein
MPNTVVKLTNAESTWLEAAWEDRKLLINESSTERLGFLLYPHSDAIGRNGWEEQAAD